ncbi:MAG: hypothetical protein US40_C0002G0014 [Candidatus Roizmanbacteria bacterium GW2011_GWC2_37_13]|uniref:Uncharacterized protein n=1 Tax=Candidatus Roizmanbacteria bacterium GW2011_GWC2_37_13 TaxID=1618486 RepID=A0A0G0GK06_9BACT|nr:MAG: hypothetical protein US38_C0006G0014 [Candidatus Roizmanbacteria bacterium GW2011_GWC1_37_12]KKQ26480.1 MAG: hypothetical protein US40_C0002G0014 [Candidatus Roizmanbacteria bacterium GW2011_GWC2_37_13]
MAAAIRTGESIGDHFEVSEDLKFHRFADAYLIQLSKLALSLRKKPRDLTQFDLLKAVGNNTFDPIPSI